MMKTAEIGSVAVLVLAAAVALASGAGGDDSQGTFELRLKQFDNPTSNDAEGHCCAGYRNSAGKCTAECRTRFRVCLKHYQANIDRIHECTFGENVTPIMENNVANFDTIRFPLDFKWPGTFSLIIEAWHDSNNSQTADYITHDSSDRSSAGTLISRLATQQELAASPDWTRGSHQEQHTRLDYEYRMVCSQHYYGADCDTLCRPRDDQFGHYECGPDGEKVCLPGWQKDPSKPEGDYCTKAKCLEGCHSEHGTCEKPGQCICKGGYTGPLCDRCILYPGCVHGTCEKPYTCLCKEGWGGLFCNQDLNYCTNHRPCLNGATCRNTGQGSYTCSCPPGHTGTNCESRISDECEHQPCANGGTCQGSGADYRCVCPLGFHGRHCELAARSCADRPCQNGAACADRPRGAGYECRCPIDFQGVNCDVEIEHCRASPCQNGGTCSLSRDGRGFECRCPAGFTGRNCEVNVDDCAVNPCRNGGSCIDFVDDYKCYCHPGFVGAHCEVNVNDCLTQPCANGGTCHDSINDFVCTCPPGFTGKDCSLEVNECAANPCLHGFCTNKVNDFECKCLPGYSGKRCNVLPDGTELPLPSLRGRHEPMDGAQVAVIALCAVLVPLLVVCACLYLCCVKRRRRADRRRSDLAAERENELNAVHSVNKSKMIDDNRIVNALDFPSQKRINTNPNLADDVCGSGVKMLHAGKALNTSYSSSALCDKLDNSSVVSSASSASAASSCRPMHPLPHHQAQQQQLHQQPHYCNLPNSSYSTASSSAASSVTSSSSSSQHQPHQQQQQQQQQARTKEYGLPTAASIAAAAAAASTSQYSPQKAKQPVDLFATEV